MKKLLLAAAAACTLLAACNKESSYHSMGVVYPSNYQPAVVFADQLSDSVFFYTTDNFQLSAYESSWITIPDSMRQGRVPNYFRTVFYVSVPLTFEPNTTGRPRTGHVTLRSYDGDDWDQSATATYYQTAWHNIVSPAPAYSSNDGVVTGALFRATVGAEQESDTLEFTAYGKWTLTEGSFAHVEQGLREGGEGSHRIPVTFDANTGEEERTTVVRLSSNGVTTEIEFVQKAPEKE
ncbi:MAG: BACON domain-containing protein [Bacteroidaceae bacterium]|nr:BACON domain-containing protein [Bacteroidaceae bacterium]